MDPCPNTAEQLRTPSLPPTPLKWSGPPPNTPARCASLGVGLGSGGSSRARAALLGPSSAVATGVGGLGAVALLTLLLVSALAPALAPDVAHATVSLLLGSGGALLGLPGF
jgi:hypothetical protein